MKTIRLPLVAALLLGAGCSAPQPMNPPPVSALPSPILASYHSALVQQAMANENFRQVLFTGNTSQLVLMSIPLGGEVGAETHPFAEQTLIFLAGSGEGELDGRRFPIRTGDVVVVTVGTRHNFWNTGPTAMKIITTYAPANHIDGRVHRTKADADADRADEEAGESAPRK